MADNQVERRAEDRGGMRADVAWIKEAVKSIATDVKSLDCKKNTEIINILKTDYDDRKESEKFVKQQLFKTAMAKVTQAGGFIVAGAASVYAFLK